jgi:fimbrial chaperone protein
MGRRPGRRNLLEATEEVIATPPIFARSGQKQIVRCSCSRADPTREVTYRLVLQETALNDPPPNAVQALLRISMPVFITPPGAKPNVVWTLQQEGDRWWLRAENTGNAHAQINAVRTIGGADIKATGYLLAGETKRIAPRRDRQRTVAEDQRTDVWFAGAASARGGLR